MKQMTSKLRSRFAFLGAAATIAASATFAADKNGVSNMAISRPAGPGSLEGLGDSFQPSLNTGTAKYSVNFALPEGIAGFTPTLMLKYDSGRGCGIAGMGWSLDTQSVRRQTDEGQPRYFDQPFGEQPMDRFLGVDDEEIVPLVNGFFLSKTEGLFMRYARVGDGWESRSKSGILHQFGTTDESRISDAAGKRIYRWWLDRQTDTHGNVIEYDYARVDPASRQVYLTAIHYGPGAPPWKNAYHVELTYESRPDLWADYRPGFRVATTRRLKQVDVRFNEQLIRRYVLTYEADPNSSLLTTVTQFGSDGVSALPTTTFEYATFQLGDPAVPINAAGKVFGSVGEPAVLMDVSSQIELIDLNADALPDLISTDGTHLAYINLGPQSSPGGPVLQWQTVVAVDIEDGRVMDNPLSDVKVHLADMTGDGTADWIVTGADGVDSFANTGRIGWAAQKRIAVQKFPPPAPYASPDRSVLSSDVDFDKRMDVIKSEDGAYSIWINQKDGQFSDRILTPGARFKGKFLHFADQGVQLTDMNGDRLNDVAEVTSHSVVYCPGMGFGLYDDCIEISLPVEDPALELEQIQRARLIDINGDGLSDLVIERFAGSDLRFWLHMPDDTFARSRVITGLPATPNAVTRFADMNGNGTVDIVYADSTLPESRLNVVDIGLLVAGSAHLNALTGISNGYGRKTTIVYQGTTSLYLAARAAGNPWNTTLPFPMAVVSQSRVSIGLDLDGWPDEGPHGDVYLTDFVYRDGYFDPLREQFRGFAFVKQIQRGDERFGGSSAPTLVTRHFFHTGAPDGIDNDNNGEIDEFGEFNGREEEPLKGAELWRETTVLPDTALEDGAFADDSKVFERVENSYVIRELATETDGPLPELLGPGYRTDDRYERTVRQLVPTATRRTIIERRNGPAKVLRMETDLDAFGNKILERNDGDLSNPADNLVTETSYALNESAWIVDRPASTLQRDGTLGTYASQTFNYYDGDPFVGLPNGQVGTRGRLHRTEAVVSFQKQLPLPPLTERSYVSGDPRDPDGRIDSLRQEFDAYGNVIVTLDGNAGLDEEGRPDGNGHHRVIEFDSLLRRFPVRETVVVGGDSADLSSTAGYDFRYGTPQSITDWNGNETRYEYDVFGRLVSEILPGDDSAEPSTRYAYNLGSPVSRIRTTKHAREGDSPDFESVRFFDGLGRKLAVVELGGPVTREATVYDTRGFARKEFQPFDGGSATWTPPVESMPGRNTSFDATGRPVRIESPPDAGGISALLTTEYLPLIVRQFDGEDNIPGAHFQTPRTFVYDGLNRLIEVQLVERLAAQSGTFVTRYRYTMPDRLAEIEDAGGNVRYMRYDGLSRKIFMNDPDRGHMAYRYDAVGNLVETIDAKGQRIAWAFDGANRPLSEDYQDEGTPLGRNRTPDVAYHYDVPHPSYPWLRNTRGRVAWVEDLTGAEYLGYDRRNDLETVIKKVDQLGGGSRTFQTTTYADSLHRVYQTIYPDGGVVRHRYDSRGLLAGVPGFVEEMTYEASNQRRTVRLANGVETGHLYDARLRLTRLLSTGPGGTIQDLTYTYDQADNLVSIGDGRGLLATDPRSHFALFAYDDSYRLLRAQAPNTGNLLFEYDPIHNMIFKANPMIAADHLGSVAHGGAAGSQNRIGRQAADPPGPHAATSTSTGGPGEGLTYDANGNLTQHNDRQYDYDFRDRLGRVGGGSQAEYLYDYSNRRVIKRVNGVQTTYVNRMAEVRGSRAIHYAFAGDSRCARIEGTIPPPAELSQRIGLREGWNLVSFQVTPPAGDPETLLAPILDNLLGVFALRNGIYVRYIPGGVDELGALSPNEGYWVHMAAAADWVVEGSLATTTVSLPAGVAELAGIPGLSPRDVATLAEGSPAVTIWRYDGENFGWSVFDPSAAAGVNTFTNTRPGEAYWIRPAGDASIPYAPPAPPEIFWYMSDHLGSTDLVTNAAGQVASETIYFPFGQTRHRVEPGGPAPKEYEFSGKERDEETGLYYFDGRYYSPHLGRFITVDPLLGETPDRESKSDKSDTYLNEPENFNLYAYAQNNPLSRIDPTGMETVYLVNKARTEITVRTNIVIYGPKASPAVATKIKQSIEEKWNQGFKYDGKTVKFQVSVKTESSLTVGLRKQYGNPGSPDLIYIGNEGRSYVTDQWFGNIYNPLTWATMSKGGSWYLKYNKDDTTDELARVAAHEYGHVIGLPDRYKDVKNPDGSISSVEDPGWEGNIMASDAYGKLEQRNIDEALKGKDLKEE